MAADDGHGVGGGDGATRLVGRDRELAALRAALDAALAGRGSLVLIGGEAGIGKTTLAEAVCAEAAARGALVLTGRSYDLSETPPYGPWTEAFARVPRDDGLPAPPDLVGGKAATSQAALFAQVRTYLRSLATRQPVLLFLDDLHWADPASLDLLRVAARELADLPVLLVCTHRADELASDHPLYRLVPLLLREAAAAPLTLAPLAEATRARSWRPATGSRRWTRRGWWATCTRTPRATLSTSGNSSAAWRRTAPSGRGRAGGSWAT